VRKATFFQVTKKRDKPVLLFVQIIRHRLRISWMSDSDRDSPRSALRLAGIYRNLHISARALASAEEIELWPGQSIASQRDPVCYLVGVANRNVAIHYSRRFPSQFRTEIYPQHSGDLLPLVIQPTNKVSRNFFVVLRHETNRPSAATGIGTARGAQSYERSDA